MVKIKILIPVFNDWKSVFKLLENIDKEFLRKWYIEQCDPYNDEIIPEAPIHLVNELSRRYIMLYEIITGNKFDFLHNTGKKNIQTAIKDWLEHKNDCFQCMIL